MILRYLYNEQLAQASYMVGCSATGEALVVDPNRDIDQYIRLAEQQGLRITAVTETHIHADFVSGSRELAARTGAQLYLSDEGTSEWKYSYAQEAGAVLVADGNSFKVGNVKVDVVHTPGHTPEHISFLITDTAGADQPMGVFTGDFVFVGDVGRPDLLEKAAGITGTMEAGARQLFATIQRFRELPNHLQVWPGHGAGSACGRALGAVPQSTVGYEKLYNWAFQTRDESEFVRAVLLGQPEPPTYFAQMKRVNREGPALVSDLPLPGRLDNGSLEEALRQGAIVVDTRPAEAYGKGFIPGTINISSGSAFLTWSGWLLPYDRPFALIVEESQAENALQQLRLIGFDNVEGYWTPDVLEEWKSQGRELSTLNRVSAAEARRLVEEGSVAVLDVRGASENAEGRIAGSTNIPLGYLQSRLDELPGGKPVLVHCAGGVRSAIAASLLAGRGDTDVVDLQGGFSDWQAAGNPVERGVRESQLRDEPAAAHA